jgi:outer membrane lipoprotein-sorting protein
MEISMVVKTRRAERTMKMKSYSVGQEKSFIKVLYPKKDEGITFLKMDNSMWQYVPRIEKTIKIPASMMLQSWMGSDFSNDDLVKESSLSEDYTSELIAETKDEYSLYLHPKVDAAVVWGKIQMAVSKEYYLPTRVSYYDEDGVLVRELLYTDVKAYGERFYPSLWIMTPKTEEKKGHETRISVSSASFDGVMDDAYFSKRALKRFSR